MCKNCQHKQNWQQRHHESHLLLCNLKQVSNIFYPEEKSQLCKTNANMSSGSFFFFALFVCLRLCVCLFVPCTFSPSARPFPFSSYIYILSFFKRTASIITVSSRPRFVQIYISISVRNVITRPWAPCVAVLSKQVEENKGNAIGFLLPSFSFVCLFNFSFFFFFSRLRSSDLKRKNRKCVDDDDDVMVMSRELQALLLALLFTPYSSMCV